MTVKLNKTLPFSRDDLSDRERVNLLSAAMNSSLDAIISIDCDGRVIEWSKASTDIFGYSHDDVIGKKIEELIIPSELRKAHRDGLEKYLYTGEHKVLNQRIELEAINSKNERFPIELAITPVHFRGDVFFVSRIRNIESRKRYERQLQMTAKELAHREKNSLAIVTSIFRQLTRMCSDIPTLKFKYENWLNSYKKSLEQLSYDVNNKGMFLRKKLDVEFEPYKERIFVTGDDVFLHRHSFLNLSICIHEQLTNSIKYGSLSVNEGTIDIHIVNNGEYVTMHWIERGGPKPSNKREAGFGTLLLKNAFVIGMQGTYEFRYPDTGFDGKITFPVSATFK